MKKTLALLTSLALVLQVFPMQAVAEISQPSPTDSLSNRWFTLHPPTTLGRIVDYSFNSSTGAQEHGSTPLVILIQDLHANASVQNTITKLLQFYDKQGVLPNQVLVEGAEGLIDSSLLATIPDADLKEEVCQDLITQGDLTGAEYFAAQKANPRLLYGAEKDDYYRIHRDLFQRSYAARKALAQELGALQSSLQSLEHHRAGRSVKKITDWSESYKAGDLTLVKYLDHLEGLSKKSGISWDQDYPALSALRQLETKEKEANRIKPQTLRKMTEALLGPLSQRITPEEKVLLADLAQRDAQLYYAFLAQLVQAHNFQSVVPAPLADYLEYQRLSAQANLAQTDFELSSLAHRLALLSSETPFEKNLLNARRDLELLQRLLENQLTDPELRDLAPRLSQLSQQVEALSQAESLPNFSQETLTRSIQSALDFYALALLRDKPLAEKALENPRSVLITGGFHSQGMAQILKERGVSYIVLSPTVPSHTQADSDLYTQKLLNNTDSLALDFTQTQHKLFAQTLVQHLDHRLHDPNQVVAYWNENIAPPIAQAPKPSSFISRRRALKSATLQFNSTQGYTVQLAFEGRNQSASVSLSVDRNNLPVVQLPTSQMDELRTKDIQRFLTPALTLTAILLTSTGFWPSDSVISLIDHVSSAMLFPGLLREPAPGEPSGPGQKDKIERLNTMRQAINFFRHEAGNAAASTVVVDTVHESHPLEVYSDFRRGLVASMDLLHLSHNETVKALLDVEVTSSNADAIEKEAKAYAEQVDSTLSQFCQVAERAAEEIERLGPSFSRHADVVKRGVTGVSSALSRLHRSLAGVEEQLSELDLSKLLRIVSNASGIEWTEPSSPLPRILVQPQNFSVAISNLIRNAREAVGMAGQDSLRIKLQAEVEKDRVKLTISDNGPGISLEHLPLLFQKGFTTKPDKAGHGIGMSIVHDAVTKAGGTIEVLSKVKGGRTIRAVESNGDTRVSLNFKEKIPTESGTVFTLWLPIAPESPQNVKQAVAKLLPIFVPFLWSALSLMILSFATNISSFDFSPEMLALWPILPSRKNFADARAISRTVRGFKAFGNTVRRLVPKNGKVQTIDEEKLLALALDPRGGMRVVIAEDATQAQYAGLSLIVGLMEQADRIFSLGLATGGTHETMRKAWGCLHHVRRMMGGLLTQDLEEGIAKVKFWNTLDNYAFGEDTDDTVMALSSYPNEQMRLLLKNMYHFAGFKVPPFVAPGDRKYANVQAMVADGRRFRSEMTVFLQEVNRQLIQLHGIGSSGHDAFNEIFMRVERLRGKYEWDPKERLTNLPDSPHRLKLEHYRQTHPLFRPDGYSPTLDITRVQNFFHFGSGLHPFFLKFMADHMIFDMDKLLEALKQLEIYEIQFYYDEPKYQFHSADEFFTEFQRVLDNYQNTPGHSITQGTLDMFERTNNPDSVNLVLTTKPHKAIPTLGAVEGKIAALDKYGRLTPVQEAPQGVPSAWNTASWLQFAPNTVVIADQAAAKYLDKSQCFFFQPSNKKWTMMKDDVVEPIYRATPGGQYSTHLEKKLARGPKPKRFVQQGIPFLYIAVLFACLSLGFDSQSTARAATELAGTVSFPSLLRDPQPGEPLGSAMEDKVERVRRNRKAVETFLHEVNRHIATLSFVMWMINDSRRFPDHQIFTDRFGSYEAQMSDAVFRSLRNDPVTQANAAGIDEALEGHLRKISATLRLVCETSLSISEKIEPLGQPFLEYAEEIKNKVGKIQTELRIMNDYLATGGEPFSRVDVMEILRTIFKDSSLDASLRGAEITLEKTSPFESQPLAQHYGLLIALENLVQNAAEAATRAAQAKIQIKLKAESAGNHVKITVADNGPGIDFQPSTNLFKTVKGYTSKSTPGHGFGLGIIWNVVSDAGGKLEIISKVKGKPAFYQMEDGVNSASRPQNEFPTESGTIFTLWLPIAPEPSQGMTQAATKLLPFLIPFLWSAFLVTGMLAFGSAGPLSAETNDAFVGTLSLWGKSASNDPQRPQPFGRPGQDLEDSLKRLYPENPEAAGRVAGELTGIKLRLLSQTAKPA